MQRIGSHPTARLTGHIRRRAFIADTRVKKVAFVFKMYGRVDDEIDITPKDCK
jgi:hypothetical protein